MVGLIITVVLLASFAGLSKAICDTVSFRYSKSIFTKKPIFWNPEISWRNKYRGNDPSNGSKFPGSTTLFVAFTDAWHLFGLLERLAFGCAAVLSGLLISKNTWFIFLAVGSYVIFAATFHLCFTYLFKSR